ncbi:MAG: hypothetical protein NWQ05_01365 [Burkholderiaceae bacterium]|jgi:cytochrome b|nr:hypothetical protein [Burkholderiaceae bacterium]
MNPLDTDNTTEPSSVKVWGLVGTRYARFAEFVRSPAQVWAYIKSLRSDQPQHFVGHNPVGAVAVIVLMGLTALSIYTG